MGDRNGNLGVGIRSLLSPDIPYDAWVPLHVAGQRPSARYKHAAAVVHGKLYIVGGSRHGHFLSDIQILDFETSTWSEMKQNQDKDGIKEMDVGSNMTLPPLSSHSLVKLDNNLLVVAGNSKKFYNNVSVWSVDLIANKCVAVKTYGEVPISRGGQSVTLVGSKLIMFGGEDGKRRPLNDLYILELESMQWKLVTTSENIPAPRFDHTATAYADRYLLIFGGCSHSTCFNDLHILDLQTMEWSEAQVQGDVVNPRAGHAGTLLGGSWYIAGGGDNRSGFLETIKLNMSKLTWSVATRVAEWDPLASEGLSICSDTIDGEQILVAFGGYNGKYQNEVFVLKIKPSVIAPPQRILQSSAAAAAAASVSAAYALRTQTKEPGSRNLEERETKEVETNDFSQLDTEISVVSMEKKMMQSRLTDVKGENERLDDDLKELKKSHSELSMELKSVQRQLEAERSRCFKLELQVADIKKKLETQHSIEHELAILHQQVSSTNDDYAEQKKPNSRFLQWMAGAASSAENDK